MFNVDSLLYSNLSSNQHVASCTHIDHINVSLICSQCVYRKDTVHQTIYIEHRVKLTEYQRNIYKRYLLIFLLDGPGKILLSYYYDKDTRGFQNISKSCWGSKTVKHKLLNQGYLITNIILQSTLYNKTLDLHVIYKLTSYFDNNNTG